MLYEVITNTVVFSPDGKYIATASDDNTARVWDAATGEEIFVLNHDDLVYDVVFSPDGKYVATASSDTTARIWNAVITSYSIHYTKLYESGYIVVSNVLNGPVASFSASSTSGSYNFV